MHDEKKKINMKLQNNNIKIKMQNNLECNNMNQDTSKNKVRKENEEECKYTKRCLKYIFFLVRVYYYFDNN